MISRSVSDVAVVAIAAVLLVDCQLLRGLRPGSRTDLRVEVTASRNGFEWAPPEDQRVCAEARAYPEEVASVLREALADGCPPCEGSRLSFRLLLLNEPVGQRAGVVSLVLLKPDPRESARTLAGLSSVLSQTRLPPVPKGRSRCTLQVSIALPRPP